MKSELLLEWKISLGSCWEHGKTNTPHSRPKLITVAHFLTHTHTLHLRQTHTPQRDQQHCVESRSRSNLNKHPPPAPQSGQLQQETPPSPADSSAFTCLCFSVDSPESTQENKSGQRDGSKSGGEGRFYLQQQTINTAALHFVSE